MRFAFLLSLALTACGTAETAPRLATPETSAAARLAPCTTADCFGGLEGKVINNFGDVIIGGHVTEPWPSEESPTIPLAIANGDGTTDIFEGLTGVHLATILHGYDNVTGVGQITVTDGHGTYKELVIKTEIGDYVGWTGTLVLRDLLEGAAVGETATFDVNIEDWYYSGQIGWNAQPELCVDRG